MPKSNVHVVRRVRGTMLTFNPMGRPKVVNSDRVPLEMEEAHNRRVASMLKNTSLPEHGIPRCLNEPSGTPWEVWNEEEDDWNEMGFDPSAEWVEDEPEHLLAAVNRMQESNDENIDVHIGSHRVDFRTREDRLLRQQEAWSTLYPAMVDAYLQWDSTGPPPFDETTYRGDYHAPVKVFDLFDCQACSFPLTEGNFLIPTMVRHGYIGNAPLRPSCAFSLRMLELFRVMNSRCPQLSIHRFVRGLCDLQQTAYPASLRPKFSSAYDAYLQIIARTAQQLQAELGRDTPDWRLKNACPACTFKTPNEPHMKFSMLLAMDGNNSLRRMPKAVRQRDENGKLVLTEYTERLDSRSVRSDLYLSNDYVDNFKNEVKRRLKPVSTMTSGEPLTGPGGFPTDGVDQPTPCVDRWTNLSEESSKKMWGMFHETGIFLATCRHGIALLLCDMIRSGELAKYPLSLLDKLIDTYGSNLLIGYDIGCGFASTAAKSPKIGPKMSAAATRFCVGSFHGHAHCRLCQLDWHPLHVEGSGIEDFETCERIFSESNNVAGATRHASAFHRRQAIFNHFVRWNSDKYAELSQFITNNYRQSLRIIRENTTALANLTKTWDAFSPDVFMQWLNKEKAYLLSLKKPEQSSYQSLRVNYVQTLKKLETACTYFEVTSRAWITIPVSSIENTSFYEVQTASTQSLETARLDEARARGLDSVLTLQAAVRGIEIKLDIDKSKRWTSESPEWKEIENIINRAEYQAVVDKLEGLVIARLFELSKLNQSGIGVKLRTHIAKALKVRSAAIRKAIEEYNAIAPKFSRSVLDIDTVLRYVSLGEFDLLRESQYDPSSFPWMGNAQRTAMVLHFKRQRAKEEIIRLNVEVQRLYFYMHAEEQVWENLVSKLQPTQPFLSFQAAKHLKHLVSLNQVHNERLARLSVLDGYSGPTPATHHSHADANEDEDGASDNDEVQAALDVTLSFVGNIE